jgi:hypothetical protein
VAYVPNDDIDLIGPVAQVLRIGYGPFGIAAPLVTVGDPDDAGDARRPGERRLHRGDAPADGGRVGPHAARLVQPPARHLQDAGELDHARRRELVRDRVVEPDRRGHAEAFQLLFNASGIFYALTYVVMFAIPLFGLRGVTPRPPLWLRLASLSGC